MDRVLLVIDNVQFTGHLENTLRKIGYTVESLQSEFNIHQKILGFNPEVIVVKGAGPRLSTLTVAKKLKEQFRYTGRIVLVFPEDQKNFDHVIFGLGADRSLYDPISALGIANAILDLEPISKTSMQEKLFKMAESDAVFRKEDETYLVRHGLNYNDEILRVRGESETRRKIEKYNKQIENLDVDLKKGLSKRQTKAKANRGLTTPHNREVDEERKRFTNALFSKK